jgi:branched-chain amino acid transport system substrate-binding protein
MAASKLARIVAFALPFVLSFQCSLDVFAAEEPVRLGVLNDQSGPTADAAGPGSAIAARPAIEDFGGSVLGRPIELVVGDHQNKTDLAGTTTRRWIDVDKVVAILDGGTSAAALVIQQIAREKERIVMFSGPATSDLTGKACSPYGFHWTYDTYALANTLARALVKEGNDTWFFLTSDYAFGHALERDATKFIESSGGKVVGRVRHPLNTADFSSFILQAQSSRAKIIGLANSADDALNSIKQAAEFGVTAGGQKIGGLLLLINQIHGLGLKSAQGTQVAESFYWDMDEATRNFSRRFEALAHKKPNMIQAGVYSAATHYLKSVQLAKSVAGSAVAEKMRTTPVNDFMSRDVTIRKDGRVMRDMYVYQVKTPQESTGPWDYYKKVSVVRGDDAFRPASESECPLLKE